MKVAAIVVAAGAGQRLGADLPKALVPLAGRPLLTWAVRAFAGHADIHEVIAVVPAEHRAEFAAAAGPARAVIGGDTRQASVAAGLSALSSDVELVLVHDAARPLVTAEMIGAVVHCLRSGVDAVIPVVPVIDTIKRVDATGLVVATLERGELRAVQTPQGFRRSVLAAAHASGREWGQHQAGDDAGLVEAFGLPVQTVPGDEIAFKITTRHDLELAHRLVTALPADPQQATPGGPA